MILVRPLRPMRNTCFLDDCGEYESLGPKYPGRSNNDAMGRRGSGLGVMRECRECRECSVRILNNTELQSPLRTQAPLGRQRVSRTTHSLRVIGARGARSRGRRGDIPAIHGVPFPFGQLPKTDREPHVRTGACQEPETGCAAASVTSASAGAVREQGFSNVTRSARQTARCLG